MKIINLFKYYSPVYESNHNLSFYTQGGIYFQQPIKFNDPWDCKAPSITMSRQINALKQLWFDLGENNGHVFNDSGWEHLKVLSRCEIKRQFTDMFEKSFEKQRKKIGVFSLSFIPDSELMWSHYAESHYGYMLHFQIDLDEDKATAGIEQTGIPVPVIYKSKRHAWNLVNYYKEREKHMYDLIRFKSESWKYERELRILNTTKHGFIDIPKNWLKSIVIGINTKKDLSNNLKNIGSELNLNVYSATMSKDKFKIIIPDLEIDGIDGKKQYQDLLDTQLLDLNVNKKVKS